DLDVPALVFRGQLLFRRTGDGHLWLSDGSAAGTRRLLDAFPYLTPFDNAGRPVFAELQGKLFFLGAADAGLPPGIWRTDWTPAGTEPLGFPAAEATVG